jgi:hypothetical protein
MERQAPLKRLGISEMRLGVYLEYGLGGRGRKETRVKV